MNLEDGSAVLQWNRRCVNANYINLIKFTSDAKSYKIFLNETWLKRENNSCIKYSNIRNDREDGKGEVVTLIKYNLKYVFKEIEGTQILITVSKLNSEILSWLIFIIPQPIINGIQILQTYFK